MAVKSNGLCPNLTRLCLSLKNKHHAGTFPPNCLLLPTKGAKWQRNFRTPISSAGKSYDESQKCRKPLQADCTPMTSKGRKRNRGTYITWQSLDHMWQVCFSAYEVAHEKTAIFINMPICFPLLFGGMWDLINSSPIQNRTCIGSAKSSGTELPNSHTTL